MTRSFAKDPSFYEKQQKQAVKATTVSEKKPHPHKKVVHQVHKKEVSQSYTAHYVHILIYIVLITVIVFLIAPSYKGYYVEQEFRQYGANVTAVLSDVETLRASLTVANTTLATCQLTNEKHLQTIISEKNRTQACLEHSLEVESDLTLLHREYSLNATRTEQEYARQVIDLEDELSNARADLKIIESDYDSLVVYAATNICCKAKVDDSSINSYTVSNNRIICGVGQEEELSC